MNIFNVILVQPLVNLIVLIYSLIPGHDFGIAIILVTIFIRLIIWPLQGQTLKSQKAMQELQPEIKKLQDKYKNDSAKLNEKLMELYKEKEVNPFSSCLPSLLQLPIMIALFYAILKFQNPSYLTSFTHNSGLGVDLYGWVKSLGFVKEALSVPFTTSLLGIVDLAKPSYVLAILAGVVQYFQTKMLTPKQDGQEKSAMSFMLYAFPVLTIIIGLRFPAALPLYWIVTTLMAILQQYLTMRDVVEEEIEGTK